MGLVPMRLVWRPNATRPARSWRPRLRLCSLRRPSWVTLRARAPGGSSSQPGSSVAAAQLAAERRTVQRLRASVAGSSVRVDTLLNRAELHVVETEGTLYSAVEEVFGTHHTDETRLAALYEAVSSSVRSLVELVQSLGSSRGTKRDSDE